ncbi:MAG TPA: hypothetical protein VKU41_01485 [Polyangiaceae bacterium]|nr:hypothetical protein [Polyangiaceae bacterium]
MSVSKLSGVLTAFGLAVAVASGCSSSNSGSPNDGGATDVIIIGPAHKMSDAATTDDGGSGVFDGTVGQPCKTMSDCQPDGGAMQNVCSNAMLFTLGPVFPTPVCILPMCDPGQDGNLHFCDGPDMPTSPGVCLPTDSTGTTGVCLPQCQFPLDGSPTTGCQGKDVCNFAAVLLDTTSGQPTMGVGFCQGGCTADADCPTGSHCQTNEGVCVSSVKNPTKKLGQACSQTDATNRACNCLFGADSPTAGYCTQFCTIGGAACPAGYICDTGEPLTLTDPSGNPIAGFPKETMGLAGTCNAICSNPDGGGAPVEASAPQQTVDAGADGASDAASTPPADASPAAPAPTSCPTNSTCGNTTVMGWTCVP